MLSGRGLRAATLVDFDQHDWPSHPDTPKQKSTTRAFKVGGYFCLLK
jgi:hypothetical protein